MTEIRVGTPGESSQAHSYRANIQMQGFAAGGAGAGDGDAPRHIPVGPFGSRTKDPGAGANPEVKFQPSSVHSEPDLDTIMPLPPGSYSTHAHHNSPATFRSWPAAGRVRAGSGTGVGAGGHGASAVRVARTGSINRDAEESENSSEEDVDVQSPLVHSPRSIGFTNVEVSDIVLCLLYKLSSDSCDNLCILCCFGSIR